MAIVGLAASCRYGGNATGLRGADHATGRKNRQENDPRKRPKKTIQENNLRKPNKQDLRKEEILKFCIEPKSLFAIMQYLNLKARKNVMNVYINPMLATGVLKMTEPDNPTSRNQMYVTVKE